MSGDRTNSLQALYMLWQKKVTNCFEGDETDVKKQRQLFADTVTAARRQGLNEYKVYALP